MKKLSLLFIIFFLAHFGFCKELDKAECLEDLDSLEEIFQNYCISTKAIQKSRKFNINEKIRKFKNNLNEYTNDEDFFITLCDVFENIPDHHISFSLDDENCLLLNKDFGKLGENESVIFETENANGVYISFSDFDSKLAFENINRFETLDLSSFRKLILDLRGNVGGDFEVAARFLYKLCGLEYQDSDKWNLCKEVLLFKGSPYLFITELSGNELSKRELKEIEKGKSIVKSFKSTEGLLDMKNFKSFHGKLFIIVDGYTASSSECLLLLLKQNFEAVKVLGLETAGAYSYGGLLSAELPNSKIKVNVTQFQTLLASEENKFLDSDGILPDYWCVSKDDVINTLQSLGVDNNLLARIKDFYEINL